MYVQRCNSNDLQQQSTAHSKPYCGCSISRLTLTFIILIFLLYNYYRLLGRHYGTATEGSAVICKLMEDCAKLSEENLTLTNCKIGKYY